MADWKDQLRGIYTELQKDQKNKKGIKNKFDDVVGYKNKKGFNDTGIPLTPRAAKNLRKNKASYRYRYEGSTLQQINEERAAAAKKRWAHLKSDPGYSKDTSTHRSKDYSVSEMKWRSSATSDRDNAWSGQHRKFVGYGYSDPPPEEESVTVEYIVPYEKKEPEYKTKVSTDHNGNMKFRSKVDESIWNLKNNKY